MVILPVRRPLRLKSHDYVGGWYFVTICTGRNQMLFGEIEDGQMKLNPVGKIVEEEWLQSAKLRMDLELDVFVIMPNHVHGILALTGMRAGQRPAPTTEMRIRAGSLGSVISQFKGACTKRIKKVMDQEIWQRGFYDRIIRNEAELTRIRNYIQNNPLKWELNREKYHNEENLKF
jgi:putative transposase